MVASAPAAAIAGATRSLVANALAGIEPAHHEAERSQQRGPEVAQPAQRRIGVEERRRQRECVRRQQELEDADAVGEQDQREQHDDDGADADSDASRHALLRQPPRLCQQQHRRPEQRRGPPRQRAELPLCGWNDVDLEDAASEPVDVGELQVCQLPAAALSGQRQHVPGSTRGGDRRVQPRLGSRRQRHSRHGRAVERQRYLLRCGAAAQPCHDRRVASSSSERSGRSTVSVVSAGVRGDVTTRTRSRPKSTGTRAASTRAQSAASASRSARLRVTGLRATERA